MEEEEAAAALAAAAVRGASWVERVAACEAGGSGQRQRNVGTMLRPGTKGACFCFVCFNPLW